MTPRNVVVLASTLIVLTAVALGAAQKERVMRDGRIVLLALAPVDPRSLMQGDYMALRYAIADDLEAELTSAPIDGELVLTLDGRGVVTTARRHGGEPLGASEALLRYRVRGHRVRLGAESFFFEEGRASRYERAAYGELRVDDEGESVLVGLRDAELRPLR